MQDIIYASIPKQEESNIKSATTSNFVFYTHQLSIKTLTGDGFSPNPSLMAQIFM